MNDPTAFFARLTVLTCFLAAVTIGLLAAAIPQQQEYELVQYEVVRIACQMPDGCDITLQQEGNRRPLNLRCRDGCVLMAQDTVQAQTTLRAITFEANPER
jgi:hypothetical protein